MCVQDRVVVHWWRELVATLEATNPTRLPFTCVAKYNFFFCEYLEAVVAGAASD